MPSQSLLVCPHTRLCCAPFPALVQYLASVATLPAFMWLFLKVIAAWT